jgi:hypothetical protein
MNARRAKPGRDVTTINAQIAEPAERRSGDRPVSPAAGLRAEAQHLQRAKAGHHEGTKVAKAHEEDFHHRDTETQSCQRVACRFAAAPRCVEQRALPDLGASVSQWQKPVDRSQRDAQKFKFPGESMSDSRETSIVFVNFVSLCLS